MGKEFAKLDSAYSFALESDDYRGFEISYFEIDVDDELVNHRFEELLQQVSFRDLADEPIQADDRVVIDYEGTIADDALSGKACSVRVGFNEYLAPIEQSLVGRVAGESYALSFDMPSVHVRADWQGAPAAFDIRIVSASRAVAYEATDAYVASVSEFGSVDELKQVIREQYEFEVQQESYRLLRVQASEKIGSLAKEHFQDDQLIEYARVHMPEEMPAAAELSDEQRRNIADSAAFEIGWRNIARVECIAVTDEQVDDACRELKKLYRSGGRSKKELKKEARDGLLCEIVVNTVLEASSIGTLQSREGGAR